MASLCKSLLPALIASGLCALSTPLLAQSLTETAWVPTAFTGEAVIAPEKTIVQFDVNGTVFGNGGCNNFNGSYITNRDSILFGPAAATMMLCEDPASAVEMKLFRALDEARFFSIEGDELTLSDAEGAALMTLSARAKP